VGLVSLVGGWATVRIWQQGTTDEAQPADAIVVLGAAQYDGQPSPVLRARLDHALSLYHRGLAPVLVLTGGKRTADRMTEAAAARDYVVRAGVPESALLLEDQGANTRSSLANTASLMAARGLRSAILVSDPTHLLRSLRIAVDLGLDAWGSPAPDSPTEATLASRLRATTHELGGLASYFFGGPAAPENVTEPGAP
jgi:uncharacterized SAM-binding protein YcdF (DUF218 family)